VTWTYRKKHGLPLDYGDNSLGYVENILKMMFKKPNKDYVENPIVVKALNKLLNTYMQIMNKTVQPLQFELLVLLMQAICFNIVRYFCIMGTLTWRS